MFVIICVILIIVLVVVYFLIFYVCDDSLGLYLLVSIIRSLGTVYFQSYNVLQY